MLGRFAPLSPLPVPYPPVPKQKSSSRLAARGDAEPAGLALDQSPWALEFVGEGLAADTKILFLVFFLVCRPIIDK